MFTTPPRHRPFTAFAVLATLCASTLLPAQVRGRVELRTYHFEEAGRDVEYALFVPKGYDEKKPAPLIVLLHGLGSNPKQVIGYQGITGEAGRRGYIVVAPYGYNSRGWYGSRGKGKKGPFFGNASDPDNLGELSEKDVTNVLGIVRSEFAIDDDRIYLMGHSMGGAGTIHFAATRPEIWAAVAPLAPALDADTSRLKAMRHVPVKIVSGDQDRMVRVGVVRRWVEAMKALEMDCDYVEIEGGDHVRSIASNPKMIATVFDFFDGRRRSAPKTAAPRAGTGPSGGEPAGKAAAGK